MAPIPVMSFDPEPTLSIPDFDPSYLIGQFNWPRPSALVFPHPGGNSVTINFTKEEYAQQYHMLTRYEYCAKEAKRLNGAGWTTMKSHARYDAIMEIWNGLDENYNPYPKVTAGQALFEKYFRNTTPQGAMQKANAWLLEYYSSSDVEACPSRSKGLLDN